MIERPEGKVQEEEGRNGRERGRFPDRRRLKVEEPALSGVPVFHFS
jgi:hypothetical protein